MYKSKLYWAFTYLASIITECVSISAFAFLVDIPVGIVSSAVGTKICSVNTIIEKYKSIIKKGGKTWQNKIFSQSYFCFFSWYSCTYFGICSGN